MIENIVLDMGNVVTEYRPHDYAAPFAKDEANCELLVKTIFLSVEWQLLDKGLITYPEATSVWQARQPEAAREIQMVSDHWYEHKTIIAPVNRLAVALKKRGYHLYLLSNASDKFPLYQKSIPALAALDGWVLSYECHLLKPDPAIFKLLFDKYSLEPKSCFFVDDIDANIETGRAFGMDGFVFPRDESRPDAARRLVDRLRDLGVDARYEDVGCDTL